MAPKTRPSHRNAPAADDGLAEGAPHVPLPSDRPWRSSRRTRQCTAGVIMAPSPIQASRPARDIRVATASSRHQRAGAEGKAGGLARSVQVHDGRLVQAWAATGPYTYARKSGWADSPEVAISRFATIIRAEDMGFFLPRSLVYTSWPTRCTAACRDHVGNRRHQENNR